MPATVVPELSIDEIDDLLFYTRTNDETSLQTLTADLAKKFCCPLATVLEACIDPEDGNTAIHYCSANGFDSLLSTFLSIFEKQGADENEKAKAPQSSLIDHQNKEGNTPIHWAAYNGHLSVVKLLLSAGANMWIKNNAGHLALFEAERAERNDVVQYLLEAGGTEVEQTGNEGVDDEDVEIQMSAGDVS